jgi:hypothetical protein
MSKMEVLKSTINICDIHSLRLQTALEHVKHIIPITEKSIDKLTDIELSFLDQITKRFSMLQDTIGSKIFSLTLELLQEDVPDATFIDRINKLEKIGALESAEFWKKIKKMRNEITHEYPDEKLYMTLLLNECLKESIKLLECWDFLKKFIEKRGLID